MIFRIEKTNNYTVMSNYHLKEKTMSLKAKGLLSLMLSLPNDWDFTIEGLCALSKDGKDSVRNGIMELVSFGYVSRKEVRNDKGQYVDVDYTIYEQPISSIPKSENQISENPIQLNTNILNTNNILSEPQKSHTEITDTEILKGQLSFEELKDTPTKDDLIEKDFEEFWKLVPSTTYDKKKAVTKKTKEFIHKNKDYIKLAIELYLKDTNEKYRFKRDNFFNNYLENYVDRVKENKTKEENNNTSFEVVHTYNDFKGFSV